MSSSLHSFQSTSIRLTWSQSAHLHSVVIDEVFVSDALEDPEFFCDVPQRLVVVGLQGQLLHRHYVARLVVDGRVHLAKSALESQSSQRE